MLLLNIKSCYCICNKCKVGSSALKKCGINLTGTPNYAIYTKSGYSYCIILLQI